MSPRPIDSVIDHAAELQARVSELEQLLARIALATVLVGLIVLTIVWKLWRTVP